MDNKFLLGIDIGTSGLKSILMDQEGNVIAEAAVDYQFLSPQQGYTEQDPETWWEATLYSIKKLLQKSRLDAKSILSVGFSGQMHGLVMLDKNGKSIRPAILHNDGRSSKQVEQLNEIFDKHEIFPLAMNRVYSGFLLVSLLWIRENEPENYKKICCVMSPKDYVRYKLTGIVATDHSDASATLAYDIRKNEWNAYLLELLEIDINIFPPIYDTCEVVGTILQSIAQKLSLSKETRVVAGGGDQVMQSIGNGLFTEGDACVNIGTAGQVSFQSDEPRYSSKLLTNTFVSYQKGRWYSMGAIMNAGLCLKWYRSLFEDSNYEEWNKKIVEVKPGSGGLIFLPYLNGERTPCFEPNLSGSFFGLNLSTGKKELARAVMEGVTFALYDAMNACLEVGLNRPKELVVSGGGARSKAWLSIQADIYGIPLKRAKVKEQACVGAAIAAGVGVGVYRGLSEACRQIVSYEDEIYLPDETRHILYQEYYEIYKNYRVASYEQNKKLTIIGRNRDYRR